MEKNFIFFSNYESPKSKQFEEHNQISALIYWNTINTQIRINGLIKRTDQDFNQLYFSNRNLKKNALAISSKQSQPIPSYDDVRARYNEALNSDSLDICPDYWGGFTFKPTTIEIWKGEENRLNKREKFARIDGWKKSYSFSMKADINKNSKNIYNLFYQNFLNSYPNDSSQLSEQDLFKFSKFLDTVDLKNILLIILNIKN